MSLTSMFAGMFRRPIQEPNPVPHVGELWRGKNADTMRGDCKQTITEVSEHWVRTNKGTRCRRGFIKNMERCG